MILLFQEAMYRSRRSVFRSITDTDVRRSNVINSWSLGQGAGEKRPLTRSSRLNMHTFLDVLRIMMLRVFCSEEIVSVEMTQRRAKVKGWVKI